MAVQRRQSRTRDEEIMVLSRKPQLVELWASPVWRGVLYLASSVVLGALGGLVWSWITPLAHYTLREDLVASITERGNAQIVATDIMFAATTGVLGVLIGVLGWMLLSQRGWLVTFLPPLAACVCAAMAWRFGMIVGSRDFDRRIATASAGDVVPIDLMLRAQSVLLVAPFATVSVIMLMAAFWPERGDGQTARERKDEE